MNDEFNKEDVYDEQISPLMTQIIKICHEHQIPHVISFFIGGDDGDLMCSTTDTTHEHTPENYHKMVDILYPSEPSFMAFTITRGKKESE